MMRCSKSESNLNSLRIVNDEIENSNEYLVRQNSILLNEIFNSNAELQSKIGGLEKEREKTIKSKKQVQELLQEIEMEKLKVKPQ